MEKLTGIKGIIFDYGGTIDSRGEHWSEVIFRGYAAAGIAIGRPEFREAYVYAERELARTLHILPHHNFRDLMEIKIEIELQYLAGKGLFAPQDIAEKSKEAARYCYESAKECIEEARPVIEALGKKYPLVLVSNFYGNVESVLKDFGIDSYFRNIIESAVVKVRKPDPKIFMLGVEALGLMPEEVAVIGDSYTKDIVPARSIGCKTLWLKGKGWTEDEDSRTDDCMITTLREALDVL